MVFSSTVVPATQEDDVSVGRMEVLEGDEGGSWVFTRSWNDLGARSTTRIIPCDVPTSQMQRIRRLNTTDNLILSVKGFCSHD